jgi:hypothetical protein
VAHPERRVRERLLARVDALIVSRQPFISLPEVHDFFDAQHGPEWEMLAGEPRCRALAERLVCLLFARRTRRHYKRWLRVTWPAEDEQGAAGLLIRHPPLRASPASWPASDRPPHNHNGCRLDLGLLLEQIALFDRPRPPLRVRCRIDGAMSLELQGPINWGDSAFALSHGLIAGRSPARLGLHIERPGPNRLRLTATTPEAIIQLSACLARGESLLLPLGHAGKQGWRVVVGLCDFEGDEAELPTVLSEACREDWLRGLPKLELDCPDAEMAAVARWAYVPHGWLSPELACLLLPERGELLPAGGRP